MSELNIIANLLRQAIKDRQTLAVGNCNAAATKGQSAIYTTPSGNITAIATNFCYGQCLLAKIEGVWYAVNPADNQKVVRSSVDRFIHRKPKVDQAIIYRFVGLNKFEQALLLNYRGEDLSVYPDGIASVDFNPGEIIFRIFDDETINPNSDVTIESVSAETGYYYIAYITEDRSNFVNLRLSQPSISIALPSGIDNVRAIYGRGFVAMQDRNTYRFENANFYQLTYNFTIESSAESTAGAIVLWERNNPTIRNKIIAFINSNTSIDGWNIDSMVVPRTAVTSHEQIDDELPLFKTQIQFETDSWSIDRSFTFGTRSKNSQVLSFGLINSEVYQDANIFVIGFIRRELYGVVARSTILERDEVEHKVSKTYLVGVGGLELKIDTIASGTTFELAGTVEDLWTLDRRTDFETGEELDTLFWKLFARIKANYTRSMFVIPTVNTCTIGSQIVDINSIAVEVSTAFNPNLVSGFEIEGAATFISEQIETTYCNYDYVDNGILYVGFNLIDGAADYKDRTTIVRRLAANPLFDGLKYLVAITANRIYNLQIDSRIESVYRYLNDDPIETEAIFTNPIGCQSQDYGFYPAGLRYAGDYKRSTTAYNFKRDWGAQSPAWKFQFPISIPNLPPLPDYHPFASADAIGCQSNNPPTLTVFGITSQTFYDPNSVLGTYTEIASDDSDVPNLHYARRVTGFNCSIVSSYEIAADWITTPKIIMPHPDYFANNSTLMGKNAEGVIELYRSRESADPIPATVEKWIVNASNRFELVDYFAPELSDSVVTGSAIATQYYPY